MPELHSDRLPKVEQMPPIEDISAYEGDVVIADPKLPSKEYLAELAFMEEPVTIRLEPSHEKNAATAFPVWVNGKPAEVHQNGRWYEVGWLPTSQTLIVKRKVLEVIARAKIDTLETKIIGQDSERPNNVISRFTSPIHSFSVLEDSNPKGPAWLAEVRRRNV